MKGFKSIFKEKPNLALSRRAMSLVVIGVALSLLLLTVGTVAAVNKINDASKSANAKLIKEKTSVAEDVDLANALRTSTVNVVYDREAIPAYSNAQVRSMDVSQPSGATEEDLKLVTAGALVGLEDSFAKGEADYGVNCLFVMAIASIESANGTMCYAPNNMFGFGGLSFSSKAECIDTVSESLAHDYLSSSGGLYRGKTISDVNKRYAASSTWDDKVANKMTYYYSVISKNHNAALEKLK
ncbi:MAG: hypothetical protein GX663_04475 [Clostridiales bacterium]|nr:hypothetical protein [Clostridiales bacterium]